MDTGKKYDVVILGGGFAGLTLALQLKGLQPEISLLILEKRIKDAPIATHKVGESTSDLAAAYLREKLHLSKYLDENQLLKHGMRFFFSSEHKNDITRRVQVGTKINSFYPAHQLDRGIFENDLAIKAKSFGTELFFGALVKEVNISKNGHEVLFLENGVEHLANARWVIDSTGRSSFLKRKFGLHKEMKHHINAAWFRLDSEFDIDYWSNNLEWRNQILPGQRRLATNHLMGEGYWVWLIPLASGATSIGIVADPLFHPFETFNTFEKAMHWLGKYEPLAAERLAAYSEKVMDFKVMKNFAYDTKQFFSADKWAVTGEAGAFMDPLYSPGSDVIGFGNTWISDLIVRDLKGEDISLRLLTYERAIKELLEGWVSIYENMYGIFGKSQIMLIKIMWDWSFYWGVPCVLFMNDGFINLNILKQYSSSSLSIGTRLQRLNTKMQSLFVAWGKHEDDEYSDFCGNLFEMNFFRKLQEELPIKYNEDKLILKIEENLNLLEKVSSEIFRRVSYLINETPLEMKVNPYEMSIEDGKEELIKKSENFNTFTIDSQIQLDIEKMWLQPVKLEVNL